MQDMTDEYFRRVSYDGSAEPTLDTLAALVAAHNGAHPVRDLDPMMGTPIVDLEGQAALADKLVHPAPRRLLLRTERADGGYVLAEMEFGVDRLAGRVVWMSTSEREAPAAQTHEALSVTVPGDGRAPGSSTWDSADRRCRRRSGSRSVPFSRPATSPTECVSTVMSFYSRPRSPASGNPFTPSTPACAHRSTGKSEVGTSQRIRDRFSSPA